MFLYEPFSSDSPPPPTVINARSLEVTGCFNDILGHFNDFRLAKLLDLLTATRLENLTCTGLLKEEDWQTSFRDFISRSQCPLKTLILHCDYTGEYLPQLLPLLPTLTNLTLHCDQVTVVDASVFDGLITTVEPSSIVPRLQQLLTLSCCVNKTETQPLLLVSHVLTMAESRSRSTSRVESLNAIRLSIKLHGVPSRNECDLGSESLLRLLRLNEDGMAVSITLDPSDA
ncbi:hypothetical protein BDP27DRAFT_1417833 [Rhodocollybia butyracea]|uniref:Uncharacterized protein n=1 Tax=Rhodocollybia butyracea TaxID=206335 RepID=A0A9P5Q374_9AGAR|nr:hypothetical protein BDP27DRAFT_1417833 [Rhodocollybia butyracea]